MLAPLLGRGDFLLNLSVECRRVALIEALPGAGALYLDTCIEPWAGRLYRPVADALAALQLRAARERAGAARRRRPAARPRC